MNSDLEYPLVRYLVRELAISKPDYFFADGEPYFGPVHTGKGNRKFTGMMHNEESVQVFTEDDFMMMEAPQSRQERLGVPSKQRPNYSLGTAPSGGNGGGTPVP